LVISYLFGSFLVLGMGVGMVQDGWSIVLRHWTSVLFGIGFYYCKIPCYSYNPGKLLEDCIAESIHSIKIPKRKDNPA
jgi:hypothetical protein